jgi:hypothetical protein
VLNIPERSRATYRGPVGADPSLRDEQLQDEIDLVEALVLAAAQAPGPLTLERIDELLGVAPEEPGGPLRRPVTTAEG